MIGIIFHPRKLERIVKGQQTYENVDYYFQLAAENEVDLFFYSLRHLSPKENKVKGYYYSHTEKRLEGRIVNIPKVNLFRTIVHRRRVINALRQIEKDQSVTFINMASERNKYKINQYLRYIKKISDHIPHTELLTYKKLLNMLKMYGRVIIKPVNGALGEKIVVLDKRNAQMFHVTFTFRRKQYHTTLRKSRLYSFYKKLFKKPASYLVQQLISIEKYEGKKYDIRTSVQKDRTGDWKVTGIVTRVAGKNDIVTNVAQGGRAVAFRKIHPIKETELYDRINRLSIDIALELEKLYPSTADLGLDIAIDEQGKLWFIEANYCDERYAYRESQDYDMWAASYRTPFEYALATYEKTI